MDDLRYAFKKLDPPLELDAVYEEARERFVDLEEFKVIESEESRKSAFEKFIRRQKVRCGDADDCVTVER